MSTLVEKYYTPELEEFYPGFEYEYLQLVNGVAKWKKDSFGRVVTSISTLKYLFDNGVRVKHLDHEDIESLGWYSGRLQGLNEDSFTLNDNQLYWQDNQFIQIYNWNSTIIFEGIIKNKSELRRLMKQLRI